MGEKVLQLTNGELVLEGGNLNPAITNSFTLDANNKVISTNKTSVSISLSDGSFKGSVLNAANQAVPFSGVLLQNRNAGWGHFAGTNQSGRVYFGPPGGVEF
jgi:hypothetical protein